MKKNFSNSVRNFVLEWTINILILLFGTTTLVQAFIVPTPSMDHTIRPGDHLLVDKLSYAPPGSISRYLLPYTDVKRGDIIVFRYPVDISQNYVKRVIGVPGDHIKLINKVVYLNGKPLTEPYVEHVRPYIDPYADNFPSAPPEPVGDPADQARAAEMLAHHVENGEVVVPPGNYFAMGDNRDDSADSRYWGFVPRENIIGKPLIIFWSYDASAKDLESFSEHHFLDLAKNFFTKTRWNRELKLLRPYPIQ
ncbi:MAG TPA: signal peptidase I [Bryobacteraceae bacterium]|nr:signal peptidase I [Bryobacteraceae bacterium]